MAFRDLGVRLAEVRDRIAAAVARGGHGQQVTLVAVTKSHGPEAPLAAWENGIGDVGENRVQEALQKMEALEVPLRWHLIGHLQRNKVKYLDRFVLLHSLDSSRLAVTVDRYAESVGRPVDALVQVNVAGEETKGGFVPEELSAEADRLRGLDGLRIRGVMTMAPFDAEERELRRVFGGARAARGVLVEAGLPATELSMGMSNDYEIAIEEGATMVRLGTTLFGERPT